MKIINKNNIIFTILALFYTATAISQSNIPNVSIDCTNNTCTPNFTVNSNFIRNEYNAIDVGGNNANITVNSQNKQAPRSLRMSITNGPFPDGNLFPGYDLNVSLSSSTKNSKAGSFVLVGDNFKNLNIQLNGYNGKTGKNAAAICADNIKSNLYGPDTLSFFNNFRLNNPSVSSDSCTLDDINFLQANKFKCDSGFTEVITTNSIYSVNVQRIPKINRCQASLSYDVCLRRKTQMTCNWSIFNGTVNFRGSVTKGSSQITAVNSTSNLSVGQMLFGAGIPQGTAISNISGSTVTMSKASLITNSDLSIQSSAITQYGTSINRIVPENQYTYFRNLSNDTDLCNNHVAQEVSDPNYSTPDGIVNPLYSNPNSYAGCSGSCYWRVTSLNANLTTPGMNGDQLAVGSDWEMKNTKPGDRCDTSSDPSKGFWSTHKSVNVNYVAYDVTDARCRATDIVTFNGGTINLDYPAQALDPDKQATWFYTGIAQEADFGTEVVQCDLGNCPVDSVASDLVQKLDTITPEDGENGTQQGTGILLIYDAQNIVTKSDIGIAGGGGSNDIINQVSTRVCVKVKDAQSDGLGSDYSRNPLVNFNRYNWTAIKTNASGNPGQQPPNLGSSVTVWKKIDSSVRAFLQNELFNQ